MDCPSSPPSTITGVDALATVAVSFTALLLLAPWALKTGIWGIAGLQVVALALPVLLLAKTRTGGFAAIGIQRASRTVIFATTVVGATLWLWNVHWVAYIGMDWSSAESLKAWEQTVAVSERPFITTIIVFALVPAVCEELLHRGVITPALEQRMPWPWAVLVSALLFGAVHFSLARLLPTMVLGAVAAVLRIRSGSLWPAILVHLLYNLCLLSTAYFFPHWQSTTPLALGALVLTAGALLKAEMS